jgi:putative phosphoesterase
MPTVEITLGVIADTHVPDRRPKLEPRILPLFRDLEVQAILHAGDVSARFVLNELEQVAPVFAVKGNRDFIGLRNLPMSRQMVFGGVTIGMTHGHFGWPVYVRDRLIFMFQGYDHERLIPRLLPHFPHAKVIVFGHGHLMLNRWVNRQLLFNPGSPHFPTREGIVPSLGFLHIQPGGKVIGEIVYLD